MLLQGSQDLNRPVVRNAVIVFVDHFLKDLAVQIRHAEQRHAAAQLQVIRITEDLVGCEPLQLQKRRGNLLQSCPQDRMGKIFFCLFKIAYRIILRGACKAKPLDLRGLLDALALMKQGGIAADLKQEENIQNTYTGICPYWKGIVLNEDGTEEERLVTLAERVVHSEKASNFPYQRTKIVDFTSEYLNPPTEEQLRQRAERYIRENDVGKPNVSLKVSFIALHQTQEYANLTNIEHINLCDTVTVVFPQLEISTKAKVVRTVLRQQNADSKL